MGHYVGLDVSLESTHICVLDGDRRVVWRSVSDRQIPMLAEYLAGGASRLCLLGLRRVP